MSATAEIISGAWGVGDIQASTSHYGFSLYENSDSDAVRIALCDGSACNDEVTIPDGYDFVADYPSGTTMPPIESALQQSSSVFTAGTANFWSSDGVTADKKYYSDFYDHANGDDGAWFEFEDEVCVRVSQFEIGASITTQQYYETAAEYGSTPGGGLMAASDATGSATPKNPLLYLRRSSTDVTYFCECGESEAQCGEDDAQCGNTTEPVGYPLVNNIRTTTKNYTVCAGDDGVECGEDDIECGAYDGFTTGYKDYIVPSDETKWPYFTYIGGETFGATAEVDASRQAEFETLCLKLFPTHQWLGMLIDYI